MSVTIKDVAKKAGVAASTVSRVIANSNRISQKTKEKVYTAMEELGYHPNYNARSLAVKNTKCIGLIMPKSTEQAFQNPFFPEVIRGISAFANQNEYALFLTTGSNETEQLRAVVDMVQGRRVDGVISLYSKVDDPVIEYLLTRDFPFVMIGKPSDRDKQVSYVDNDNVIAAKKAVQHLLELDHRRIGFVGGSLDLMVTRDRLQGYREALYEASLTFEEELVVQEAFLPEGGYKAMKALIQTPNPPTALIVVDDVMALGVISALHEMGLEVPKDISVASINDVAVAKISSPPLTTVNIGIYELGYQATAKLLHWINQEQPDYKPTIVDHQLVIRQSTAKVKRSIEEVKQ